MTSPRKPNACGALAAEPVSQPDSSLTRAINGLLAASSESCSTKHRPFGTVAFWAAATLSPRSKRGSPVTTSITPSASPGSPAPRVGDTPAVDPNALTPLLVECSQPAGLVAEAYEAGARLERRSLDRDPRGRAHPSPAGSCAAWGLVAGLPYRAARRRRRKGLHDCATRRRPSVRTGHAQLTLIRRMLRPTLSRCLAASSRGHSRTRPRGSRDAGASACDHRYVIRGLCAVAASVTRGLGAAAPV